MAFRFLVTDGDKTTATQWYDEPHPSPAPQIATKIRNASPDAVLRIERNPKEAASLNKANETNDVDGR